MKSTTVLLCSGCVLLLGILLQYRHVFLPESQDDEHIKGYAGPPTAMGYTYFTETFPSQDDFNARWVLSKSTKHKSDDLEYDGVWKVEEPWSNPFPNDLGLVMKTKSRHHAVSVMLDEPFIFFDKTFVVQYEVRFQNGQSCGGAYLKLLSQTKELDLTYFSDRTQYTIMFGPDTCSNEPEIHFIMQHRNPLTRLFEEKNLRESARRINPSVFNDRKTHLFTLVIQPNNSFEIHIDKHMHFSGNLLTDMSPPINPAKEFPDTEDKKPEDWDDRKEIPDPDVVKPDDWDENEPNLIEDSDSVKPSGWFDDEPVLIPDPMAEKPDDWNSRRGEWKPPLIRNPKCMVGCGKWTPFMYTNPKYKGPWNHPTIANPDYKGEWRRRMLPNPKYFEDLHPFRMTAIAAIGLELWSVSKNSLFDNFIVTDDRSVADMWAADSWVLKRAKEKEEPEDQDPGIYRTVVDAAEDQPFLWSIIALLFIVPVVGVIVFCGVQARNIYKECHEEPVKMEVPTSEPVKMEVPTPEPVKMAVPIPDAERDERGTGESVANQDTAAAAAAAAATEASGDNDCDARQGGGDDDDVDDDDACGKDVSNPADWEEFLDICGGDELLQEDMVEELLEDMETFSSSYDDSDGMEEIM